MKKIGWLLLLALAACSSPQGIKTTGKLRIQSVQPDVVSGCTVRAGDWMALKGNTFGTQADWDAGTNHALFPPIRACLWKTPRSPRAKTQPP